MGCFGKRYLLIVNMTEVGGGCSEVPRYCECKDRTGTTAPSCLLWIADDVSPLLPQTFPSNLVMLQKSGPMLCLWEVFLALSGVACLCCCSFSLWWGALCSDVSPPWSWRSLKGWAVEEGRGMLSVSDSQMPVVWDLINVKCTVWLTARTGMSPLPISGVLVSVA